MVSQHMHINAFNDVWLGSNTCGLLEKLQHDMMHAFLHGVLMYVVKVIMMFSLNHLDTIVDEIDVPVRSSMKRNFPRCSFAHGNTNLTLLAADEGLVLLLLLL